MVVFPSVTMTTLVVEDAADSVVSCTFCVVVVVPAGVVSTPSSVPLVVVSTTLVVVGSYLVVVVISTSGVVPSTGEVVVCNAKCKIKGCIICTEK